MVIFSPNGRPDWGGSGYPDWTEIEARATRIWADAVVLAGSSAPIFLPMSLACRSYGLEGAEVLANMQMFAQMMPPSASISHGIDEQLTKMIRPIAAAHVFFDRVMQRCREKDAQLLAWP